jgi:CHAD domain-containing protein
VAPALKERAQAARQARRILRQQVRKGLKKLAADTAASDTDIHDARKHIKQARATLRLLLGALPRADYRREDQELRAAAHPLSVARDAKVLVEALDSLAGRFHGGHLRGTAGFRHALLQRRTQARREVIAHDARLARRCMRRARKRASRWPLDHQGWRELLRGATRLYQHGREALADVRHEATAERLHHWRKQAKYLYLQLEVLSAVCAPAVGRLAAELHSLSEVLGEDHDLAVLRATVAAHIPDFASEERATALVLLIERARSTLQKRALLRGERLYRQPPQRFARLLRRRPRSRGQA